jgi:hypothetical protein
MHTSAIVLGALLAVAGAIWIAQGLNLAWAPRSFMTADRTWVVLGAAAVAGGIGLVGWGRGARLR